MRSRALILKFGCVYMGSGSTTSSKGKVDIFVLIDVGDKTIKRVICVKKTNDTG